MEDYCWWLTKHMASRLVCGVHSVVRFADGTKHVAFLA